MLVAATQASSEFGGLAEIANRHSAPVPGSASLHEKQLVLTVVNPDAGQPCEARVVIPGASVRSGAARVLAREDIHARNTFEHPRDVEPTEKTVDAGGGELRYLFAPASVTRLELELG